MSSLFTDEDLTNLEINNDNQPVTVLGKSFANDNERRQYFREELRKKLPELKKLEGYPIGEDDDIINLSDPPYYTACPNPWLKDFVAEWEKTTRFTTLTLIIQKCLTLQLCVTFCITHSRETLCLTDLRELE